MQSTHPTSSPPQWTAKDTNSFFTKLRNRQIQKDRRDDAYIEEMRAKYFKRYKTEHWGYFKQCYLAALEEYHKAVNGANAAGGKNVSV